MKKKAVEVTELDGVIINFKPHQPTIRDYIDSMSEHSEWKEKTCENCFYQVDGLCRKNPPNVGACSMFYINKQQCFESFYPAVFDSDERYFQGYQLACSHWRLDPSCEKEK